MIRNLIVRSEWNVSAGHEEKIKKHENRACQPRHPLSEHDKRKEEYRDERHRQVELKHLTRHVNGTSESDDPAVE